MCIVPEWLGLKATPDNPVLSPRRTVHLTQTKYQNLTVRTTKGIGPKRVYLDIQSKPPSVAYPPRPVSGSIADLDFIMEHCDFSEKKVSMCARQILLAVQRIYFLVTI